MMNFQSILLIVFITTVFILYSSQQQQKYESIEELSKKHSIKILMKKYRMKKSNNFLKLNKNMKMNVHNQNAHDPRIPEPKVYFFEQLTTHFNFRNQKKWKQKYLVCDKYYKKGGPIFFYAGNEGDIEMFYYNSGFMFEAAPKFNALIIFLEHRYYGDSYPDKKDYQYLNSVEALADFAYFLQKFNSHLNKIENISKRRKVISFGGSYGGMLAAWLRAKYPHIVDGSIAASAPIAHFPNTEVKASDFYDVIYNDYKSGGCIDPLKRSLFYLQSMLKNKRQQSIYDLVSQKMKLCSRLKVTEPSRIFDLYSFIDEAFTVMAQYNYPVPTDFSHKLPAYPMIQSCNKLKNHKTETDAQLFEALNQFVGVYYNFTGTTSCYKISEFETQNKNKNNNVGNNFGDTWTIQSCTEFVMPIGNNDEKFIPYIFFPKWDLDKFKQGCEYVLRETNLSFQPDYAVLEYGARNIGGSSNIVLSNGKWDPYSMEGIVSKEMIQGKGGNNLKVVYIAEGAHHTDLRLSESEDPESVKKARQIEIQYIEKFLED